VFEYQTEINCPRGTDWPRDTPPERTAKRNSLESVGTYLLSIERNVEAEQRLETQHETIRRGRSEIGCAR
jgi:hypothetical protein